ncbi:MAG: hypothetical protein IPN22_11445 [Bacteroidetes bacterium]|nr:hypothetical protein [Bacteroidota bacterium]
MVTVSGFQQQIEYQQCTHCIADSTVPGIRFDPEGECNLCAMHRRWEKIFPLGNNGEGILRKKIAAIKKDGAGRKYDCVIGISGGRDSMFLLYNAVKVWNLRVLAVHFNDGFDNPVAGENMLKAARKWNVELRTITSDFRECKDLKLVDLKASIPLLNNGTDVGIGASLYSVAYKEGVKHILFGQSFRTEGIRPLAWAYFDGDLLRALHRQFGTYPLRKWKPDDAGYNLGIKEMFFYSVLQGISVFSPLYYVSYVKSEVQPLLEKEFGYVHTGAHYYDDLYWTLITYIHRVKFNIDFRLIEYSAFVRSGQMTREEALQKVATPDNILEDEKVISLCIKRLGITREEFNGYLQLPPKNWWDYPNSYRLMQLGKPVVWLMTRLGIFTQVVYDKYFGIPFR